MQPKEFMMYYAAFIAVAVLFVMRRKPRKGMRLRLRGQTGPKAATGKDYEHMASELRGSISPDNVTPIAQKGERPLNVIFNYNGESWDAYEVLGLPAGSSQERVEAAFNDSMGRVDDKSKPFMLAAYDAIQSQWRLFKASGNS